MNQSRSDESGLGDGRTTAGDGGASAVGHMPLQQLGEYRILREIAHGGMGIVYEAVQESLGRHVALKVLPSFGLLSPMYLERFRREARAAARLHHSNIVPIFGVGEHEGVHYYAMQFIQGQSLDSLLKDLLKLRDKNDTPSTGTGGSELSVTIAQGLVTGRFEAIPEGVTTQAEPMQPAATASRRPDHSSLGSPSESQYFRSVAHVGVQVAEALAYAHQQGVLHRDIKPSNLLLDGIGTVWVSDFGLAKTEGADELTQSGDIVGTLRYMPPERFSGSSDPRSDIYGLGITLYEMLSLQPAFRDASRARLVERVLHEEPPRLRTLDPNIPRDLETIVLKAIAKEPGDRYAKAQLLADDLRRFLADRPIHARRSSLLERTWRSCRRNPALASATTAAAVLLLTAVVVLAVSNIWIRRERNEKDQALTEKQLALKAAQASLYHSLVREVQSLRRARVEGYRVKAFTRLAQALRIDTPEKDVMGLRQEAVACLGDFVGLEPVAWTDIRAPVSAIALDSKGERLALGLADGTVMLRSVDSNESTSLRGHGSSVGAVAFVPDGSKLLSQEVDGSVKVWDRSAVGEWQCARSFSTDRPSLDWDQHLLFLAVTPDGSHVVTCAAGSSVAYLWPLAEGSQPKQFHAPDNEKLHCVALSPDGKLLVAGYHRGNLRGALVWDTAVQAQPTLLSTLDYPRQLAFSRDGRLLASAAKDGGVVVWETSDFQRRLFVGGDNPDAVEFSPDSQFVAIGSSQLGVVRLWHVSSNREVAVLQHPGEPHSVTFSREGNMLAVAGAQSVRIWNLSGAGEKLVLAGHAGGVPGLSFSPNGKLLASAGKDRTVKIWDPITGQVLQELTGFKERLGPVAFSPDGRLMATGDWANTIQLWDVETWRPVAVPEHEIDGEVWCVAFSPKGDYFAACGDSGGVFLWRVDYQRGAPSDPPRVTLERIARLSRNATLGLCFSPDGNLIAWSEWPGRNLRLWDLQTHQERPPLPTELVESLTGAQFGADSQHLVGHGAAYCPELWDIASGQRVFAFESGAFEETRGVKPSGIFPTADGSWLAQGGLSIRVWDLQNRHLLLVLPEERSLPWAVAWSPDKKLLAIGSSDGGLAVWNIPRVREQLAEIGLDWPE